MFNRSEKLILCRLQRTTQRASNIYCPSFTGAGESGKSTIVKQMK